MDDISEGQFSGECEAVVDDWLSGIEISHVQSCRKHYDMMGLRNKSAI